MTQTLIHKWQLFRKPARDFDGRFVFVQVGLPSSSQLPSDEKPARVGQVAPRKPRESSPDGLKTAAQAAAKLNCSIKTLNGHVASGALKYVAIGHGKRRARKMFTDTDLNEFITNQTRKDSPCPSDAIHAPRSTATTFRSNVTAFSDLRRRRLGAKPKP